MSPTGSVSNWLSALRAGETQVAQNLWDRYFPQLVCLARARLTGIRRSAAEEDVALSAFASFCRAAEAGRFPQLANRTDLWRILVGITAHKAADLAAGQNHLPQSLEEVVGREPSPAFAAEMVDQFRHLLTTLDNKLRPIAVWKMEGHTNKEIATKLTCSVSTVERKLRLIRHTWEQVRQPEQ